jgi:hypothetical protein
MLKSAAPILHSPDDRGEVIVGEDHHGGLFGHVGPGDAHRHADVGRLQGRCIVHAIAGHCHDMALILQDLDESHLVLRRDTSDDADLVDLSHRFLVAQGGKVRAGHRPTWNPELLGDGGSGVRDKLVAHRIDGGYFLIGIHAVGRTGEELVRSAFYETADDLAIVLPHLVKGRHQLVRGIEGHYGNAWELLACHDRVDAPFAASTTSAPSVGSPTSASSLTTASEASAIGRK